MSEQWCEGWPRPNWESEERVESILANLEEINFSGKRVLDLGCLYGKYGYAALRKGAAYCRFIDKDEYTTSAGRQKLLELDVTEDRFEHACGDVFDIDFGEADIVLMNGLLYHTYRQHELLEKVKRMNAQLLFMETMVTQSKHIFVAYWPDERIYVPSSKVIELILGFCGYRSWRFVPTIENRGIYFVY